MTQLVPTPRSTVQTTLTQDMRSICIGRFMMDIPAQYDPDLATNTVKVSSDFNLSIGTLVSLETAVSLEEYHQRVNAQWDEINNNRSYNDLDRYKASPQKLIPRTNGYILAYAFVEIYGTKWMDDELIKVDVEIANDAIGFYWVNGTMFTIKPKGLTNADTAQIIHNLSSYDWSEPPQKPGICLYQAFFEKYYNVSYERVLLSIDFTDHWSVSLISGMGAGRDPEHPTLLTREGPAYRAKSAGTANIGEQLYGYKIYRADDYNTPHFKGEEIVNSSSLGSTDGYRPGWKNEMVARWEVVGDVYMDNLPDVQGGKLYYPDILFQMRVETKTGFKPQDFGAYPPAGSDKTNIPTQEEFFEVWDAMVNSIRPYPGAFTPAPVPQKPETSPMPSARQIQQDQSTLDDFLKNG